MSLRDDVSKLTFSLNCVVGGEGRDEKGELMGNDWFCLRSTGQKSEALKRKEKEGRKLVECQT
jgi:hypothetical protein